MPDNSDPNALSKELSLKPSRTQVKGEIRNGRLRKWPTAWFLESTKKIQSKDVRRHIDWLLDQIKGKSNLIKRLQIAGSEIHISCYWASALGHGGPMLDARILKRVAEMNIGISFDIYFAGDVINEIFDNHSNSQNHNTR